MENESNLPFKVGELSESKSFRNGYRGAWFRCKIRSLNKNKGHFQALLEHYDFPDEKMNWTRLYQVNYRHTEKSKEKHRELMLRPYYPPIYKEKEMVDINVNLDVAVIVDNSWEVGDLVDWWTTGCYWSGRIIELLGGNKAKIQLNPPPLGEGSIYDILLKDVRPSLEWSPEFGWMLPAKETSHSCARLIKPVNQVINRQETEAEQLTAGSSIRLSPSQASSGSLVASNEVKSTGMTGVHKRTLRPSASKEAKHIQDKSPSLGCVTKTNCMDIDSGQTSAEPAADKGNPDSVFPLKKYLENGGASLYSLQTDTFEAAILDLEDYATKVKWLKSILKCETFPSSDFSPQWKFIKPNGDPK